MIIDEDLKSLSTNIISRACFCSSYSLQDTFSNPSILFGLSKRFSHPVTLSFNKNKTKFSPKDIREDWIEVYDKEIIVYFFICICYPDFFPRRTTERGGDINTQVSGSQGLSTRKPIRHHTWKRPFKKKKKKNTNILFSVGIPFQIWKPTAPNC